MAEVLRTEERTETGTKRMRRLRKSGFTPAVLYNEQGAKSEALSIPTRDIDAAIRHGSQVVRLEGKVNADALIRDLQWDALGRGVLHVDFAKVDLSQAIEVTLSIELVGTAPGSRQGGTVKQVMQSVTIECPANQLPEKIELKINDLELDQSINAGQLPLPEAAKVLCDPADAVVQCIAVDESEETTAEAGDAPAEPEVIGRKSDDGGDGEGEG